MKKEAVDIKWFQAYQSISNFDDITYLKVKPDVLDRERSRFFADSDYVPDFNYEIPSESLKQTRKKLVALRENILAHEQDKLIKKVYVEKLTEQCTKIDMLLSAASLDDDGFFQGTKKVYGLPTVEDLRVGVGTALNVLKKHTEIVDPVLGQMAASLNVTKDCVLTDFDLSKPDGSLLSAPEIRERFKTALQEIDLAWGVTLSEVAQSISVNYLTKTVNIPKKRQEYESVVEGLIEHEVKTHLQRHINGLQSGLLLLSKGLSGYLSNEEGLASYQELKVSQAYIPGLALYAGAAVAVGVIDGRPGSFFQVFTATKAILNVHSVCTGRPDADKLDNEAWKRAVRIYRGVNNIGTGRCFTRDISYWKGYLKVRRQIKEGRPLTYFLNGKF